MASSILTTAVMGWALFTGSLLGVAPMHASAATVKPCIGDLCPPKSPREDLPGQVTGGSNLSDQVPGQDKPQVMPRKKKQMATKQSKAAKAYRVSCDAGGDIVSRHFNRVQVIECKGGTYTYRGRRNGETFQILFNSRSGRIVGRTALTDDDDWLADWF